MLFWEIVNSIIYHLSIIESIISQIWNFENFFCLQLGSCQTLVDFSTWNNVCLMQLLLIKMLLFSIKEFLFSLTLSSSSKIMISAINLCWEWNFCLSVTFLYFKNYLCKTFSTWIETVVWLYRLFPLIEFGATFSNLNETFVLFLEYELREIFLNEELY